MIRITCTNCKNVLTIDDAFAGGVCRCQHCGTIQTVPAHLKGSAERAVTATAGKGKNVAKTLYRSDTSATGSGSGLDELAEVVHSSGLQHNSLMHKPPAGTGKANNRNTLIFGGVILAALIVVIIMLVSRGGNAVSNSGGSDQNPAPDQTGNPKATAPKPQIISGPSFGPIEITGNTVVYLIDDGSAAQDSLESIKQVCLRSVRSLGLDRRFLILFWRPATPAYPADFTPITASSANADDAKIHLTDIVAYGATQVDDALKRAIAAQSDEIVLITAKGDYMDADWQKNVMAIRGKSPVKIDCVGIGDSQDQGVLPNLADATGGKFARISVNALR